MLENLRSERDDLHEILRAQLPGDGAEDARAARVVGGVDQDDRIAVKAQVAAIRAADRGLRADDDGLGDLALLHGGLGGALLDVHGDDVAHAGRVGDLAHAGDHGGFAGTGVVGDFENGTQLNHGGTPVAGRLGKSAQALVILVGTVSATSCSEIATPMSATAAWTMATTRQRFRRLSGRVSMTSTLSPTLVSFFSSCTCSTVWRLTTLW